MDETQAVADVTEAIVGAAYLSGGHDTALTVTKALNIPIPNIDDWSDFGRKALAPPPDASANLTIGSTEAVESIIGHKFRRPHLLAQALVCVLHFQRHPADQSPCRRTLQDKVMKLFPMNDSNSLGTEFWISVSFAHSHAPFFADVVISGYSISL